jgi:quercetin dioxygenase-like cupin family protein
MKKNKLEDFIGGWFVGNFEPSLYKTEDVEVCVKKYKKGDYDGLHHHKIATEITCILEGEVEMKGKKYKKGDIITISPLESTDFKALTNAMNVVVKIPGATNDKYEGDAE